MGFMGDAGSTYLGGIYAGILLQNISTETRASIALIAVPLLADVGACIIKRIANGEDISKPHKKHLYQRLVQSGWSHEQVSALYIGSCSLISITVLSVGLKSGIVASIAVILLGYVLDRSSCSKLANRGVRE